jgi:predicted transcriptional regulator
MNANDEIVRELLAIKRLLAYKFLQEGMSQASLAAALDVNQSSVSRMFARESSGKSSKRDKKGI